MAWSQLYQRRDLVTGFFIYGVGDAVASVLSDSFSLQRLFGMALIGALMYGLEIPHYFHWVAKKTQPLNRAKAAMARTLFAMLYFNPLWVARHLAIIGLLNGERLPPSLFLIALQSFLSAMPLTVFANMLIQNAVPLKNRFIASALFSCFMAIYYPLAALWWGG
ncbi:MAG: hypothetical protein H7A01_11740 [Hahellaceae bacterium]|jgi:hypothetical protein|nr:hypothetical protein [Hahellaceae bacterium]MCP5210010.1 hypothetical protein [Hahellaceae bacterium]